MNSGIVEQNSTSNVLDYVYHNPDSTWIQSFIGTTVLLNTVIDQTNDWNDDFQLTFNPGTIKLNQVWETKYRLKILKAGNINIFGPNSKVIFDNGTSVIPLPKTFITAIENMTATGFNQSELDVSDPNVVLEEEMVTWSWNRTYTGNSAVTEYYSISVDGGMQWRQLGFMTFTAIRYKTESMGKYSYPRKYLPEDRVILFKVKAVAYDAPPATGNARPVVCPARAGVSRINLT
jgi:hypothetical protein